MASAVLAPAAHLVSPTLLIARVPNFRRTIFGSRSDFHGGSQEAAQGLSIAPGSPTSMCSGVTFEASPSFTTRQLLGALHGSSHVIIVCL
jgi:hypothetical protein